MSHALCENTTFKKTVATGSRIVFLVAGNATFKSKMDPTSHLTQVVTLCFKIQVYPLSKQPGSIGSMVSIGQLHLQQETEFKSVGC